MHDLRTCIVHGRRDVSEVETFGMVLKRLRLRKGFKKQEDLARKLKMKGRGSIDPWERDLYRPASIEKVLDIADALGLDDAERRELLTAYDPVTYPSVAESAYPRCDCYAQEQLPDNYIERPEILAAVREWLLNIAPTRAKTSTAKQTIALHGMGGIGKSVIARALCDDPLLQAAFPDGILFAKLGKTPNTRSKLRTWIDTLGGTISENAPT